MKIKFGFGKNKVKEAEIQEQQKPKEKKKFSLFGSKSKKTVEDKTKEGVKPDSSKGVAREGTREGVAVSGKKMGDFQAKFIQKEANQLSKLNEDSKKSPAKEKDEYLKLKKEAYNEKLDEAFEALKVQLSALDEQLAEESEGKEGKDLKKLKGEAKNKASLVAKAFKVNLKRIDKDYKSSKSEHLTEVKAEKIEAKREAKELKKAQKQQAMEEFKARKLEERAAKQLASAEAKAKKAAEKAEAKVRKEELKAATAKEKGLEGIESGSEHLVVEGGEPKKKSLLKRMVGKVKTAGGRAKEKIAGSVAEFGHHIGDKVDEATFKLYENLGERVKKKMDENPPPLKERLAFAFSFIKGFSGVALKGYEAREKWLGEFIIKVINDSCDGSVRLNPEKRGKQLMNLLEKMLYEDETVRRRERVKHFLMGVLNVDDKTAELVIRGLGRIFFGVEIKKGSKDASFKEKIQFMMATAAFSLFGKAKKDVSKKEGE